MLTVHHRRRERVRPGIPSRVSRSKRGEPPANSIPFSAAGLYFKAGLGIGRDAVDFDDGFNVSDTGFAGLLGVGYELRLARHVYLNPVVDFVGHTYDSRLGGNYRERLVNFGIGVLFQTGR